MLYYILVTLAGGVIGWFANRYWLFRGNATSQEVDYPPYQVRLTRKSSHGPFLKVIYTGADLHEAKTAYYEATGPARTTVELWTRGNHTASRKV